VNGCMMTHKRQHCIVTVVGNILRENWNKILLALWRLYTLGGVCGRMQGRESCQGRQCNYILFIKLKIRSKDNA